ncbi:lamin tail domain-containing protein [Allorhizocola rhizosphaerae]|uniref:lamin tail domain-containing protein n=1 Tax=Allorhizocola rhizosphaerae TaxID=1872709 RepID=UPI000E3CB58B|nr:lamin tail domain-containing protein [Allorhizocola rhizosphaerae]
MRFVAVALLIALIGAPATPAVAASELYFSEYVEGSSNNKALEVFNDTGSAVDLAAGGYNVQMYFNGAATAGLTVNLTGTVAAGDVFVLAHAGAAPAILAVADQTNGSGWFNGDDAIVLRRGTVVIDSIGQIGVDPGSEWGGATADNTLRRNGFPDSDPADAFDPAVQWTAFPIDTFDGLGQHGSTVVLDCGGPLTLSQGQGGSRVVTGTDQKGIVTQLDLTSPVPQITRTAFTPAETVGGTASATIAVAPDLAPGAYPVTITSGRVTCTFTVNVTRVLTVGEVQGPGPRSPLAPATGNGSSSLQYDVQGVVAQRTLSRDEQGRILHGFFLQSHQSRTDGDPSTSDGVFVFMSTFPSLIGGYVPVVGDEVVLRARVSEFFNLTQLTSASLVRVVGQGASVDVTDAVPPSDLAAANAFWEAHEGMRMRVRAGSGVVSGRDVFDSTADSEIWLVDVEDPTLDRPDPLTRRVYRDAHPIDGVADGNGNRIMLGTMGVKWVAQDSFALLPPARTFDTLTGDAVGGLYFSFEKYGIQVESAAFAQGADPSTNHPVTPIDREREFAVATYNVENLYDFRDDPFDGCDFHGNRGCPGVRGPFDYVPASEADYQAHLSKLASQVVNQLHAPDLLLVQEAEDQDICTVTSGSLACGTTDNADGKPDTLQELALAIAAAGGPSYDAAYDRDGADVRGIVAAFLYRTDRLALAAPTSVLSATPGVSYRSAGLASNADVQNPKTLNAVLPEDVDTSTGVDGSNVYTRAPQVGKFTVLASPGGTEFSELWAVSNHFSSTPQARVGQRTEQARYGAAIIAAIEAADSDARVVFGGDLNVFPRPDDPLTPASDQLKPLYDKGLHNLWEEIPAPSAYSYVFQGQAQTLDHLFVNPALRGDLVRMRAAHVNSDWSEAASDHDPQVAVFRSRARLTVSDASTVEGQPLVFTVSVSRPLSQGLTVCAGTVPGTAHLVVDFTPLVECKTLAAGATSVTFAVATRTDRRAEGSERVWLIAGGDPRVVVLADVTGVGVITD